MKNILPFKDYSVNENFIDKLGKKLFPYTLPSASTNRDSDAEIFFFSTENEEKSLVLQLFLDKVSSSVANGKILKAKEINPEDFWCTYKAGDKMIRYCYSFWTKNDELVEKTKDSILQYKGQEWIMECRFPSNIIEELYVISKEESEKWKSDQKFRNELLEKSKKKIIETSEWTLRNGIGTGPKDGWQLAGLKSLYGYESKGKAKQDSDTEPDWSDYKEVGKDWLRKIRNFFS